MENFQSNTRFHIGKKEEEGWKNHQITSTEYYNLPEMYRGKQIRETTNDSVFFVFASFTLKPSGVIHVRLRRQYCLFALSFFLNTNSGAWPINMTFWLFFWFSFSCEFFIFFIILLILFDMREWEREKGLMMANVYGCVYDGIKLEIFAHYCQYFAWPRYLPRALPACPMFSILISPKYEPAFNDAITLFPLSPTTCSRPRFTMYISLPTSPETNLIVRILEGFWSDWNEIFYIYLSDKCSHQVKRELVVVLERARKENRLRYFEKFPLV